ncbi:MAG: hypothetical protein ACI88C_000693 [Acidimicrobiales bacterium]|jgi:hypothetical protein
MATDAADTPNVDTPNVDTPNVARHGTRRLLSSAGVYGSAAIRSRQSHAPLDRRTRRTTTAGGVLPSKAWTAGTA